MVRYLVIAFFIFFASPMYAQDIVANVRIDERPKMAVDERLVGKWRAMEDTDVLNYCLVEKSSDLEYKVVYMNNGGVKLARNVENVFFSEINGTKFLSLPTGSKKRIGFILFKILSLEKDQVVGAVVQDKRLAQIGQRAELRALIEQNLTTPSFYGKVMHFKRVH